MIVALVLGTLLSIGVLAYVIAPVVVSGTAAVEGSVSVQRVKLVAVVAIGRRARRPPENVVAVEGDVREIRTDRRRVLRRLYEDLRLGRHVLHQPLRCLQAAVRLSVHVHVRECIATRGDHGQPDGEGCQTFRGRTREQIHAKHGS